MANTRNGATQAGATTNANGASAGKPARAVLTADGLTVRFGAVTIFENLKIDLRHGEILGIVGASGTGKSVLLRTLLGLNPRQGGTVRVFDQAFDPHAGIDGAGLEKRMGVLFQQGALFSSLTVRQNIQVPMREHLKLSQRLMDELAMVKITMVGLPEDAAEKYPSELSGGMIKRASLARALALDPDIVFLDEPTSGLDPIGAQDFDDLIMRLRDILGLSVFMVTHDLDSIFDACDRIAVLADRHVLVEGPLEQIVRYDHPWVRSYFLGSRSKRRSMR